MFKYKYQIKTKIPEIVTKFQKYIRMYRTRKEYLRQKRLLCNIQFLVRKKIFRRESIKNNRLKAYLHLKNVFKTNYDRDIYLHKIKDIIKIQTQFRICLAKQEFEKLQPSNEGSVVYIKFLKSKICYIYLLYNSIQN